MLETELKKLNANIEKLVAAIESITPVKDAVCELNATLEAQGSEVPARSTKPKVEEPKAEVDEPKVEEPDAFTGDDIKSMALAISRKDRSKQRDIKAKLAEHDAKLATDLKGDTLQVVGQWLEDLKDEIGA